MTGSGRSPVMAARIHDAPVAAPAFQSRFIPIQVADRIPVDTEGMTARVEELLEATLRRL